MSNPPDGNLAASDPLARFQTSIDNYQKTSRWIAGSFGAVAVALVAGLSLSDLGGLSWERLLLAAFGVALALAATVAVIHRTALVAPLGFVTFEQVEVEAAMGHEDGRRLRKAIEQEDGLFSSPLMRYRQPNKLRRLIARLEVELDSKTDPDDLAVAKERLEVALRTANRIVMFANHREAKRAYEHLQTTALVGSAIFVTGVAAFAWAAHPPASSEPISVVVENSPSTTRP